VAVLTRVVAVVRHSSVMGAVAAPLSGWWQARLWRAPHVAIGMFDVRVHVLCFAESADGIRVISFRKGNAREVSRDAEDKATD